MSMKVGTSQIDITPQPATGRELSGFVARVQPSLGVHDRLFVRGLYLADGRRGLLWLHADMVGLERGFVVELKTALRDRFGLQPHEVVVSATHTHSGPATVRLVNCGEYDLAYVEWLRERMLDAAAGALARTEGADAVFAEGSCDLAIDRRGKTTRHTDPRLGAVAWKRSDGTYLAVLANYAVHNVAMGHENRCISADMAGRAAQQIAAGLPGRPVVLFTNGGAGNLNPPAVGNDFGQMEQWGDRLARSALAALGAARPLPASAISSASRVVEVPLTRLTETEIEGLAARDRSRLFGQDDYVARRCRDAFKRWETRMGELLPRLPAVPSEPMEVQVVALGPVVFACFGAEMFSVTAGELLALSTEHRLRAGATQLHRSETDAAIAARPETAATVYVVGYANGVLGYLPPRAVYTEGGYEADTANVFYGTLPIAPGAYERVRDMAVELMRSLG